MNFLTALLVDRHKRGRLRHRGATAQGDVPPYDNRGTFINSGGKRQSMFTVADKDEYYSTGKYSNALAQFDKANGHVVTNTLQPKVKYNLYTKSLSDGADAALKGTLHAFDHPEDVLKPIGFGIANCLKEDMCISAGKEMLSDSGKAVWQSGKDILGSGYHLDDVNYLYGKNMVNEIDAIAAVRGGTALLELTGTGKVTSTALNYARFKLPKGSNANDALPVVGKTKGYENHEIKISSGAENNAKSIPLKEQLSNEMLKAQGTNLEKIDVIARVDVNGRVYVDTNQKARADKFSDPNKRTLIAENVAAKPPLKNGSPYPNSNMENAHAEIGAIQQAYDQGVTKGKSMVINVQGKDVCDYCKNDIATAAEKAGLKSVTVHAIDNRTKLPKVYVWYKGQRSIKEPQNDK